MAAFGPDEDELARLIRLKRDQESTAVVPGMLSQTALDPDVLAQANMEFGGQQKAIDAQKAMAARMMGAKGKEGHMMGRVYAAPTWSDSLANLGEKMVGGYQLRKAREADTALETSMADTASAKGEVEDFRRQEDLEQIAIENKYREDTLTQAREIADADRAAKNPDSWEAMSVHLPDGEPGTVVYNEKSGEFRMGSGEGEKISPAAAAKMIEYTASTTKGSVPASIQKDILDKKAAAYNMSDSIAEIARLEANGQETSGAAAILLGFVPKAFKGMAENALYDQDEQKQRVKNSYIDSQVKEAITTGVLSDQDHARLEGLNVNAEGLTPAQQITRLKAISDVLGFYDIELDLSGEVPDDFVPATEEAVEAAGESTPVTREVGVVEDGYQFLGGDPKDEKNWKKV